MLSTNSSNSFLSIAHSKTWRVNSCDSMKIMAYGTSMTYVSQRRGTGPRRGACPWQGGIQHQSELSLSGSILPRSPLWTDFQRFSAKLGYDDCILAENL